MIKPKLSNKFLKTSYEKLWVPIFGRILMFFAPLIEGKKVKEKPSFIYNPDDKK